MIGTRGWSVWTRIAILALCSIIVLLGLEAFRICRAFRTRVETPDMAGVASICGVALPPGTVLVHSHLAREWDCYKLLLAEVRFDRKHVDGFCKTGFRNVEGREVRLSRQERPFSNGMGAAHDAASPDWWRPDSVKSYIAVDASTVSGQVLALVSLDDRRHATVYLYRRGNYEIGHESGQAESR